MKPDINEYKINGYLDIFSYIEYSVDYCSYMNELSDDCKINDKICSFTKTLRNFYEEMFLYNEE